MYMIFFDLARLYLYTFYANYNKTNVWASLTALNGQKPAWQNILLKDAANFFKEILWQKKKSFWDSCTKKNMCRFY